MGILDQASHRAEPSTGRAGGGVWSLARQHLSLSRLLLAANLLLFYALCAFSYWLHVARPFDFSLESYLLPARVWGSRTQSLNDFVLYPISVIQTPVHGVVLGLLVAAMVGVPILIAVLYRLSVSLPFIAGVLLLAHMPWLAMTLLGSCILASVRPFRLPFRFGCALLGMLPVLVYLALAIRGDHSGSAASPLENSLLLAPWALAVVAACAAMGAVIALSQLVANRPTVVLPVLAVLFITPAFIFFRFVGADYLYYRLIETQYGPQSALLEPVRDATEEVYDLILGAEATTLNQHFRNVWGGRVTEMKRAVWQRLTVRFLNMRASGYEACKLFIADHPRSAYVPAVLYIQARLLDTRIDERRLGQTPPMRELYTDFPHVQSLRVWEALFAQYPSSPLTIAAGLRLAQLHLRGGDAQAAVDALQETLRRTERLNRPRVESEPGNELIAAGGLLTGLSFEAGPYAREAQRLLELIQDNRDAGGNGGEHLRRLASLDPHRPGYERALRQLAQEFAGAPIEGYFALLSATGIADVEQRRAALLDLTAALTGRMAQAEASVLLAEIDLQSAEASRREDGVRRLREVAERFPQSSSAARALERLRGVEPRLSEAGLP